MATLTSITITPSNPFILVSNSQLFTLTAHFSDAPDDPTVGTSVSTNWSSSDIAVATITNTHDAFAGVATAQTISGSTIITATYGGKTATTILKVGLANYSRIVEPTVEGVKVSETIINAAHNPISRLSAPIISMFTGGVAFTNANAVSGGPIGYTVVSGHPDNFTQLYIANEQQQVGQWVQLNSSSYATIAFNVNQKNLGVVSSVSLDSGGNQLTAGGNPVLVQITGEAYVQATAPINAGDFLGPDVSGKVKTVPFDPGMPTPILGFALENYSATFSGMVRMRIQICGE